MIQPTSEPLTAPSASTAQATPERLAAIDVGSNSIRLVVAEYDPTSGLTIIDEVKDQPRLAAGVAKTGALGKAEMEHAVGALRLMLDVCQRRNVTRMRGVATSAVREASNGQAFLERVKAALGLELEVIDGDVEAALSYRSVAHHFKVADTKTLVVDIGGGSLEVIGSVDGLVEFTGSFPFGAVRLTDLYLKGPGPTYKRLKPLRHDLRKAFRRELSKREWIGATIVGSGGTFTNLGRMVAARRGISLDEPVHGLFVSTADVEHLLERLAAMPSEERARMPGLNPSRADIIVAGLAVTAELLKRVNGRGLTVSAFGLREGLLLDMAGADPVPASDDPMRLVREFAERCHVDRQHGEQVRRLALTLFEALAEPIGADPEEAGLLEAAAILHDVGQLVNYKNHQKHSFQLIVHAERLNLPAEDRLLVAHICRYHRKAGPSKRHREFATLEPYAQRVVRRLSGILRVADGLDRGGTATVGQVAVDLTPKRLRLEVTPREPGTDLALECWAAGRKADVLAKLLAREVEIVQVS